MAYLPEDNRKALADALASIDMGEQFRALDVLDRQISTLEIKAFEANSATELRKEMIMKTTDSLVALDREVADMTNHQKGQRVTLEGIQRKIAQVTYHCPPICPHMTVAYVRMVNGFMLIGKSAPADPAKYNYELGCKLAMDDAVRQIWQFEGYRLRNELFLAEEMGPEVADVGDIPF